MPRSLELANSLFESRTAVDASLSLPQNSIPIRECTLVFPRSDARVAYQSRDVVPASVFGEQMLPRLLFSDGGEIRNPTPGAFQHRKALRVSFFSPDENTELSKTLNQASFNVENERGIECGNCACEISHIDRLIDTPNRHLRGICSLRGA